MDDAPGISWINILLGIWVIISPFVLGFSQLPRVMWNNIATGIAVGILAIIRTGMRRQSGWSWVNVILGIWLIISPLVVAFITTDTALWNNVILGIIITIIAWSESVSAPQVTAH
jgi:hypothetical protein